MLGLAGEWELMRNLPSAKGINGIARFFQDKKNPNNLYYSESLSVPVDNKELQQQFNKNYIFSYFPDRNKIMKNFYEDAWCELIFDFRGGKTRILLDYKCGEDGYKAVYDFLSSDTFTLMYDVKGPSKCYKIESIFAR